jgi:hypothetical protein
MSRPVLKTAEPVTACRDQVSAHTRPIARLRHLIFLRLLRLSWHVETEFKLLIKLLMPSVDMSDGSCLTKPTFVKNTTHFKNIM